MKNKKRYQLKMWVQYTIVFLPIALILMGLFISLINDSSYEKGMKNCISNGYSESYCVKGLYGN